MGLVKEFREFAVKGNVLDLAIAVVIGAAFGKIVSSIVNDIIMPPLGIIIGGVSFTDIKINLKSAIIDATGKVITPAVTMNIGNFIQTTFDFLIIAFCIFLIIKSINKFKKKEEEEKPSAPSQEQLILGEIRDAIKEGKIK